MKLSYHAINSILDPLVKEFEDLEAVIYHLFTTIYPEFDDADNSLEHNVVILVEYGGEILVTDDPFQLENLLCGLTHCVPAGTDIYVQEYSSFKEAYDVALGMREHLPRAYPPRLS